MRQSLIRWIKGSYGSTVCLTVVSREDSLSHIEIQDAQDEV
jgi:hypothetical protein